MANNHSGGSGVGLVPADALSDALYETDFYSWTLEQARLVREGRWQHVDRENVAEEIESLGREQFNRLESMLRVIMMHMLKWDHQPERRSRSWQLSIHAHRLRLRRVLAQNPGLKPRISEALEHGYELARVEAAQETELELKQFPEQCPYSWEDITEREFVL